MSTACRHCDREITLDGGRWVDPEATGDDSMWREACDANDTFTAEHEPITEPIDCYCGEDMATALRDPRRHRECRNL